jgi:hypothetical protein
MPFYNSTLSTSAIAATITKSPTANASLVATNTSSEKGWSDTVCVSGSSGACLYTTTVDFAAISLYAYTQLYGVFPFYTSTIGVGPLSTVFAGSALGFDLR